MKIPKIVLENKISTYEMDNDTKLLFLIVIIVIIVIIGIKLYNQNNGNSRPTTAANANYNGYMFTGNYSTEQGLLCTGETFTNYLLQDIYNCRGRVIIFSPFLSKNRINQLIPALRTAIINGKRIIVITKDLSKRTQRERPQYIYCERMLASIGVRILHKGDMHEKVIFVDDTILWSGSLNTLSYNGFTSEVMERRTDRRIVEEYERLLHISDILFLC